MDILTHTHTPKSAAFANPNPQNREQTYEHTRTPKSAEFAYPDP